jgi:putative flippase GtrA
MSNPTIPPPATAVPPAPAAEPLVRPLATVEIVIPVLNEERALGGCVSTLQRFLTDNMPFPWQITIADNGSTDRTWEVAQELVRDVPGVAARQLPVRGRGAALAAVWGESTADVVVYMDVDLSTGLEALLPLVAPLASGHSDVAIGTRLASGARTYRRFSREVISRMYNLLLRLCFGVRFSDAQCGFKAARTEVVRALLPRIADRAWFFDTELLLLAEHNRLRIHQVPVDWIEDIDSRVKVVKTARDDLRGMLRMARSIWAGTARVDFAPRPEVEPVHPDAVAITPRIVRIGRLLVFSVIGALSTLAYAGLYAALRSFADPTVSNFVALALCALANTEANRRWTFQNNTRAQNTARARSVLHARAGVLFFLQYGITTGAVLGLTHLVPHASRAAEVLVLISANLLTSILRFVLLERSVFTESRNGGAA